MGARYGVPFFLAQGSGVPLFTSACKNACNNQQKHQHNNAEHNKHNSY